jgi:putative ABC transport system permease protein
MRTALEQIFSNKLRSGLTMLGVIIGVSIIIVVLAIGEGGKNLIIGELEEIGTNLLWVYRSTQANKGKKEISRSDAFEISKINNVKKVAPVIFLVGEVATEKKFKQTLLVATEKEFFEIRKVKLEKGRFFNNKEEKVCIIGENVNKEFSCKNNILGNFLIIEGEPFKIVGILKKRRKGIIVRDLFDDNSIVIPLKEGSRMINTQIVDVIYVQIKDISKLRNTAKEIEKLLSKRKKINFGIQTLEEAIIFYNKILSIFTWMIGSIAGVSLIVGGIGIMNIMLVSVVERTREIGIRKAVGAKDRDILLQFLTESVIISLVGGFLGIILGYLETLIVFKIGNFYFPELKFWYKNVRFSSILIAFIFSFSVGVFFGIYPAKRASRLNPVDALRYE